MAGKRCWLEKSCWLDLGLGVQWGEVSSRGTPDTGQNRFVTSQPLPHPEGETGLSELLIGWAHNQSKFKWSPKKKQPKRPAPEKNEAIFFTAW